MDPRENPKASNPDLQEYLDLLGVDYLDFIKAQAALQKDLAPAAASVAITSPAPLVQDSAWEEQILKASGCRACPLCESRQNVVFGQGSRTARVIFIGEAPGSAEDSAGKPFMGESGALLDKMITAMKLKREDVYLSAVVKCRPPQNRNPERKEISACSDFLNFQISAIRPQVVVALGSIASQYLLSTESSLTDIRGRFQTVEKKEWGGAVKILPTFHPAYLLQNPDMKKMAWEDLQLVMKELSL